MQYSYLNIYKRLYWSETPEEKFAYSLIRADLQLCVFGWFWKDNIHLPLSYLNKISVVCLLYIFTSRGRSERESPSVRGAPWTGSMWNTRSSAGPSARGSPPDLCGPRLDTCRGRRRRRRRTGWRWRPAAGLPGPPVLTTVHGALGQDTGEIWIELHKDSAVLW